MDLFYSILANIELPTKLLQLIKTWPLTIGPWSRTFYLNLKKCFNCLSSQLLLMFAENLQKLIHTLVAVYGTNIEVSLHCSKQGPKERYLMEKNSKFLKENFF